MNKILMCVVFSFGSFVFAGETTVVKENKAAQDFLSKRKIAQADQQSPHYKCGDMATLPATECFWGYVEKYQEQIDKKVSEIKNTLNKNTKIVGRTEKMNIIKNYSKTLREAADINCEFSNYENEGGSLQRLGKSACLASSLYAAFNQLDLMPLASHTSY